MYRAARTADVVGTQDVQCGTDFRGVLTKTSPWSEASSSQNVPSTLRPKSTAFMQGLELQAVEGIARGDRTILLNQTELKPSIPATQKI